MKSKSIFILLLAVLIITSCKKDKEEIVVPEESADIYYKEDGRTVKVSDLLPLSIDVNNDSKIDFTVFVQLVGNSSGDHLYCGINPIGENMIKSTPADDERFLNMGFLIAENSDEIINDNLNNNQRWTADHGTLAIRHSNGTSVWHEGAWSAGEAHIVGIQHIIGGKKYFGWLRLKFDKSSEIVTLIDYAYNQNENQAIKSGQH